MDGFSWSTDDLAYVFSKQSTMDYETMITMVIFTVSTYVIIQYIGFTYLNEKIKELECLIPYRYVLYIFVFLAYSYYWLWLNLILLDTIVKQYIVTPTDVILDDVVLAWIQ